jgi:hypothetical protein
MTSMARALYLDSEFGASLDLPKVGSALENAFVYDAVARELKGMAADGLIEIVAEHQRLVSDDQLIDTLSFRRLR